MSKCSFIDSVGFCSRRRAMLNVIATEVAPVIATGTVSGGQIVNFLIVAAIFALGDIFVNRYITKLPGQ
jgi:hypothetical protein